MNETVALVLVKAELGEAKQIAQAAAAIRGVRWTMVVTGPYDVIVAVKVDDNDALGSLVVDEIQRISGVLAPTTLVTTQVFRPPTRGNEMFP